VIVALALASTLAWAAPTRAAPPAASVFHAVLERSVPAAGESLGAAPHDLLLVFSGPIEELGASVRVLGPGGAAWTIEVRHPEGDARALGGPFPTLSPGGYRVEWRIVSADGHTVRGDFTFSIGGDGSPPPPPSTDVAGASAEPGAVTQGISDERGASPLLIATRAGSSVALLALAGLLVFMASGAGVPAVTTFRAATVLAIAAPALSSAHAWLWASEAFSGSAWSALTGLTTGRALGGEALLAWLVAWALLLARRPGLSAGFAVAAVAVRGLGGHPAAYTPFLSVPASALHQLAVATWIGGLLYLVTERTTPGFARSAHRVSAAALGAVVVIVATGLAQTGAFVASPVLLFSSPYGALILAKVAGLAALIAFGAYHRFRLLPAATHVDGPAKLTRSVRVELTLAAVVMVVAAVLSHTPPNP
jgi:copper transport protein